MTFQSITIRLPEPVYKNIAQRAQRKHRTLEDEVAAVVTNSIPTTDDLSPDLVDSLQELRFLTDSELWQAAQTTMPADVSEHMQRLVTKQQREGLSPRERHKAEALVKRYNQLMLVRSQAAFLLKERGHNIDALYQAPTP